MHCPICGKIIVRLMAKTLDTSWILRHYARQEKVEICDTCYMANSPDLVMVLGVNLTEPAA